MQKQGPTKYLQGVPISPGVATGKVCLFYQGRHQNLPVLKIDSEEVANQQARLQAARDKAIRQLVTLKQQVAKRIGAAEAAIFEAQKAILEDQVVYEEIRASIATDLLNAEGAAAKVLDKYESRLLELDDEYIKERASDIGEVKRRLFDSLANQTPSLKCEEWTDCQRGQQRIIVSQELTPSLTVEFDPANTLAFVTERGGPTSHAAILVRSLGIPAVSGIAGIYNQIHCGTQILVNGHTGEVVLNPPTSMCRKTLQTRPASLTTRVPPPVEGFQVLVNIGGAFEIEQLPPDIHLEGVGLYRTEFEFFAANRLLSEEEQYQRYVRVLKAVDGKPVYFRLLDFGGDKAPAFMRLPVETNPYLGCRGSRLLLERPDLFKKQARALARASCLGTVHVLYPMVVELAQFRRLRQLFRKVTADLPPGKLYHGIMFEVPAACLQAADILAEADFATIGTNDLIQYLFAVDRNNEQVAYDYEPNRTVFWNLLRTMAQAAQRLDKPLCICGELAAEVRYIPKLIDCGFRSVSVAARRVAAVRYAASQYRQHPPDRLSPLKP